MRGAANSYKAAYEKLNGIEKYHGFVEYIKFEAIREFAEKLKEELRNNSVNGDIYDVTAYACIDNLVKEMGCNDG